jgi:carbon storage regulator
MLALTRKSNQKIRIGESIEISIVEIRGNQVKLGISAPDDVPILREELVSEPSKATPEKSPRSQRLIKAYRQSREGTEDYRLVNTISAAAQIILNLAAGLHDNEADSWTLVEELIRQYANAKNG